MSFTFNAGLVDDNNDSESYLKNKRHTKTQKNYPTQKGNFDTTKVNSVLEKIHNTQKPDDDTQHLGDFNREFNPPPQPAISKEPSSTEPMTNMTTQNDLMFRTLGRAPQPTYQNKDNLDLNDYSNYGDSKTIEEYYKKVVPGYNPNNNPHNNLHNPQNPHNKLYHKMNYDTPMNNIEPNQDVLLKKINYMISLLEEQQDEKTNNVTEEVILYSFLGIFIIFIVDSFAKVGKYVR
jgi:hypothetical protein